MCFIFPLCYGTKAQIRVTIFYDHTWAINAREFASYYRNTFLDTTYIALLGPVLDRYADGQLAMKGQYKAGKKEGNFSFYYPNGKLKAQGGFSQNKPIGTWSFFYKNGDEWQTLNFLENTFLVESYLDPSGVEKVAQGEGRYEGMVYYREKGDTLYVDGPIVNKHRHGTWIYFDQEGQRVYEEKYTKGKFRYRFIYYNDFITKKTNEAIINSMFLPLELSHTERFMYATNIKQSDYPYLKFLPDEDTIYFDKQWEICDSLHASYYRPTNVNNKDKPSGYIRDYHMSGQLQMEGKFVQGIKTGLFRYYHHNGQLAKTGSYQQGARVGTWQEFYPNGAEKMISFYENGIRNVDYFYSEDGEPQVQRGYGIIEEWFEEQGHSFRRKGKFFDYEKNGLWTAYRKDSSLYFKETYDKGKLVSGISYDSAGYEYEYSQVMIQPQPKGGMKNFYTYIGQKLRYPTDARSAFAEGKVLVQLIIDQNGKLAGQEIMSSPHPLLSKEASRVIKKFDDWQAGQLRGQVAKMRFILPITFSLSG